MDKVTVTDEMRAHILKNLHESDPKNSAASKVVPFSAVKRYLSIAACFAVLLAGAFLLPKLFTGSPSDEMVSSFYVQELPTRAELASAVGFSVPEVEGLPFTPDTAVYSAYSDDMAEIVYEKAEQTARFRKSAGQADNSGDYSSYPETAQLLTGAATVTLKGDASGYTLAIWSENDYSYSLSLSNGLSTAEWQTLISGLMAQTDY